MKKTKMKAPKKTAKKPAKKAKQNQEPLEPHQIFHLEVSSPDFMKLLDSIYSEIEPNEDWHHQYAADHTRDALAEYEAKRDAIMRKEAERIKALNIGGVTARDVVVELVNKPEEAGDEWRWAVAVKKGRKREPISKDSKYLSLVPLVMRASTYGEFSQVADDIDEYAVSGYLRLCGYLPKNIIF